MIRDRLLFAAAWALAFVQCATYVQSTPGNAAVAGGAGVLVSAGTSGGPTAGDAPEVAGAVNATGGGGSVGAPDVPRAGAGGSAAGAGGSVAGAGGSAAGAGSGGTAGDGGSSGSAMAGAAPGGSAGATDKLLSLNQPATSDSEQVDHPAASGNDGSGSSRWCAANGSLGHYWQVDLGATFTLSKLTINWEKSALYQFKVEGSSNASAWSPVIDQTQTTNTNADQTYAIANGSVARYVRLTATGLPSTNTWASFFELNVYGH